MKIIAQLVTSGLFFVSLILPSTTNSQQSQKSPLETYSLVKINITSPADIMRLQQDDITMEHYTGNAQNGIEVVINQGEVNRLRTSGISYEIKIQDFDSHYAERKAPSIFEMQKSFDILKSD